MTRNQWEKLVTNVEAISKKLDLTIAKAKTIVDYGVSEMLLNPLNLMDKFLLL